MEVRKEIERLESYLRDEGLIPKRVDLSSSISTFYTPKTISYTFPMGSTYASDTLPYSDWQDAKNKADWYCDRLLNQHSSISRILYSCTESVEDSKIKFKYIVVYREGAFGEGERKYGIVTVKRTQSAFWSVDGMDLENIY